MAQTQYQNCSSAAQRAPGPAPQPSLVDPVTTTPMSISLAENNASLSSLHAQFGTESKVADDVENVAPTEEKVQELEDTIRKRKSVIPSLTSELEQLERKIKATEDKAKFLAEAAAQAKI